MKKEISKKTIKFPKILSLLKFYKKEDTKIQIGYRSNTLIIHGKIRRIFSIPFLRRYTIIESTEGGIKIFLEDVRPGSIFPSNLDISKEKFDNIKEIRKSIPKSLRYELWRNHFGDNFNGKCFVCKEHIDRDFFEAGHVTSVIDGGENTLDNLRPVCKLCNGSMGIMNLKEFKNTFH